MRTFSLAGSRGSTRRCLRVASLCGLMFAASAGLSAHAADTHQTKLLPIQVETVVSGLNHPWSLAFLPDGAMLVTERSGALRLIVGNRLQKSKVAGVPQVWARGQGGLLDVVLDPDFAENQAIYLSYSEPTAQGGRTAVARARLVRDGSTARLERLVTIFRMSNPTSSGRHFGSRLVFARDKTLFITVGERGRRERAQDPFDHAGSVIRINRDGSTPADNPFADGKNGLPQIWSIGHRNPQGAALNPQTGALWTVAHGAAGGDEINRPEAGRNYGWPIISYGVHYSGARIGVGTHKDGMEQPLYYWDPSIAPSGMAFYTGDLISAWKGDLFIGALRGQILVRLRLDGDKVVAEERLLAGKYRRIRDVRQGPAGALWLLTDDRDGALLRITPNGS